MKYTIKQSTRNIVFIGMPGCGKTTVGKIVSSKLNKKFVDLDEYIEYKEGRNIPQIFKENGEKYFRNLESTAVLEISSMKNIIISTGGGVIKDRNNILNLKKNGIVIFIDRPLEHIISDVDIKNRPLLKNGTSQIKRIFNDRYELYKEYSDFVVENVSNLDELIDKVISIYNSSMFK